ncbi:hypothetical protein [Thermoactinomyces vulgaris]|uniref:hypothetical protein n=1 Tax=Thermoactinomyces vulgaris TaxID=2026 RepID=UPI00110763B7|nr:hypothetical protein [Thermoactinomyces vulgaris]QCV56454.1 hypothetical protein FA954_13025 [Thermoactinomyces vulgaris]
MVEIKYRIIEDFDELKTLDRYQFDDWGEIEGFFMIRFNDKAYNDETYHENELRPGEEGWDLITIWFCHLLKAVQLLEGHDYVAVSDIDALEVFIEFKREKQTNHLYAGAIFVPSEKLSDIRETVVTKPLPYYKYEFVNEKITYEELKEEAINKCQQYVQEWEHINPELILAGEEWANFILKSRWINCSM